MSDGMFKQISRRIQQLLDDGYDVINAENLVDFVDTSDVSPEDAIRALTRIVISNALCQKGLRSVDRGAGYYVDYKKTDNPAFLRKMLENSEGDAEVKQKMAALLRAIHEQNLKRIPNYSQRAWVFDENGKPQIINEPSRDEIVEMLRREAV